MDLRRVMDDFLTTKRRNYVQLGIKTNRLRAAVEDLGVGLGDSHRNRRLPEIVRALRLQNIGEKTREHGTVVRKGTVCHPLSPCMQKK